MRNKILFNQVKEAKFVKDIHEHGGKVFIVGGAVRDFLLEKEIKDIDLLVTGLSFFKLGVILEDHGTAENVGKSFGIIKFMTDEVDIDEPIDVALPRTEIKTGKGHKGFDVTVDHTLPVEDDLKRRDFTINSIALDLSTSLLIDPFNGQSAIESKTLAMVNEDTFEDDPLRIVRGIQFAARFKGFKFDEPTFKKMKENSSRIKEISGERVLAELEKVIDKKGDMDIALELLRSTGIFLELFGVENKVKAFGRNKRSRLDFFFELMLPMQERIGKDFKLILKGDSETSKALEVAFMSISDMPFENGARMEMSELFNHSKMLMDFNLMPPELNSARLEMWLGLIPKGINDLAINGNDIMTTLDIKPGERVGKVGKVLLQSVFDGEISNKRDELIAKLKTL